MKIPAFEIGDVVMLQSGSKYMTITAIDREAHLATCTYCSDGCFTSEELPLRSIVPIDLPVTELAPGDNVMCRSALSTWLCCTSTTSHVPRPARAAVRFGCCPSDACSSIKSDTARDAGRFTAASTTG